MEISEECLKRFYSGFIVPEDNASCFIWEGKIHKNGYGYFSYKRKTMYVHRLSWQIHNEEIPPRHFIHHYCKNKLCCNPAHLRLSKGTKRKTNLERLLSMIIVKEDGCWEYTRGKINTGYGQFAMDKIKILAHRASYELHNGAFDYSLEVCHSCNNPPCINPDHLYLDTHKGNMEYMASKGRSKRGEAHHMSKLTEMDVLEIRKSTLTGRKLSKIYKVSEGVISSIRNRKSWKHLD